MLDKSTGNTDCRITYISGGYGGKVLRNRGGKRAYCVRGMSSRSMKVNYAQVVERLPGEDPARLN